MDKRRMCPHCRAFITTDDRVCPYCNEKVGPRAIDRRNTGEVLMGFIPSARFTTVMILVINFALFIGGNLVRGGGALNYFGAETGVGVLVYHEYYRLFTAGFLHAGWLHILMNSWVLFDLGAQVEEIYGPPRMIVFYIVSTVAGFYASAYFKPMYPSVGASAGLFGLIGVMIALGVGTRNSMGKAIRSVYIRWAIYGLLFGLLPGINNTAHLGGLAAGFGLAYFAGTPARSSATMESFWRGAAALCTVATVFAFVQLYQRISSSGQ